jgi:2-succinyl-5-enolpyruvyl-6-hydroxy-3-cyclohexene-1-carboxylate synthase
MAEAVIDELQRNGVRLVVMSPGSRSAALAIAAAGHPGLDTVVALDERSAAFHALGRAKSAGEPCVVISTSGTAPANWFPAVVEADMSMTPLVLVSADRPAELRGVGANQTIDQVGMFGAKVRHASDLDANGGDNEHWRQEVCTAVAAARHLHPGPVHLNIAFREPTVPVSDDGRSTAEPFEPSVDGRPDGRPWVAARFPAPGPTPRIPHSPRGLVIAGDGPYDRSQILGEANRLGWPVLGTVLSGTRGSGTIDSYHHLLAGPLPDALRPDIVVAIGHIGPSPRLESLFGAARIRVRVDGWGRNIDPGQDATHRIHGDPADLLTRFDKDTVEPGWAQEWSRLHAAVRSALDSEAGSREKPTGPGIAHALSSLLWGRLIVGSSLPIRDVDAHLVCQGSVLANRGASGIDGLVSTALGAATVAPRTIAFLGDLSFLHDANGFLIDRPRDLTLVVANNGGGGLFDALPPARHAPDFERLFVTPQQRDFAALAHFHHLAHVRVADALDLSSAICAFMDSGGLGVVEVIVDRRYDLATREAMDEIGREVVSSLYA